MRYALLRFVPAALLVIGLVAPALSGCSGSRPPAPEPELDLTDPDLPVATYADEALTLSEFEDAYATAVGGRTTAANDSLGAYQDFLERYVNFRLKVRQAYEIGLDQDSALQAEMASYRDQLARPYFTDQAVLDAIVRDLYEKQKEEISAAHILVQVAEDAPAADTLAAYEKITALRDSIEAGMPFDEVAFRHSEDPSARRNRGDLGYFTGGRMIEPFENAAYATPVGEIAGPVRTRFGYHLLYVKDRRPRTPDIRASHILIRLQGQTEADSAAALETIRQIQDRLAAGEDFATLARLYSDDVASGRRGGDLGFFGPGRMVQPFDAVAFSLENPGDVSDIVTTQFGYHLIRLEERQTRPTYEEAYEELKQTANQLPRTALRRQQIGVQEREAAGFTFDSTLVARALGRFDADSLFMQIRRDGFGDLAGETFATIGDRAYTLGEFHEHFVRNVGRPGADQAAQFYAEVDTYLANEGFAHALEGLEERDPDFRALLEQYVDGVLLFRISEDSVWTPAAQDTDGLRAYYEAHADRYRWPERKRILAFTSPSDSMLTMVAADLDAGDGPDAILARYADSVLTLRLDTLYVADSTNSPVDQALGLGVGERTDVVPERSRLAVYVLDGIEAPRAKTFEEARAEVVTQYQEVLEAEWVTRLRERYDARTYPERLVEAFREDRPVEHQLTGPGDGGTTPASGQ